MQPFREAKAKGLCGPARQINQTVVFDLTLELGDVFLHVHVYKNGIDEEERAKNRTKSSVRSKVEHVFQVMKLKFGFVKLRYRGLKKNAHQLFVICGLVNLFLSRRKLLRMASA